MTEIAVERMKQLLGHMGVVGEVVGREESDHVLLEISGPETGLIIGKQGATLDALQYLINKMLAPRGAEPRDRKPIYVDAEGYRQRRADSLTELALRLAEKARQTRRPVSVEPMNPADRRVMHVALAEAAGVSTHSEGEGPERHLVIVPDPDPPASG